MKKIPLTRGLFAYVSNTDYQSVVQYRWSPVKKDKYARATVGGKIIYLHQFILGIQPPFEGHHKNGNGLDCRRKNLTVTTRKQNSRALWGSYSTRGVGWRKDLRKWRAYISPDGHQISLGLFKTQKEAIKAYNKAAKRLWGNLAHQNPI